MDIHDVSRSLADNSILVNKSVAEMILSTDDPESTLELIIEEYGGQNYRLQPSDIPTTETADTIDIEAAFENLKEEVRNPDSIDDFINRKETLNERHPELYDALFDQDLPEPEPRVNVDITHTISGDITGRSTGTGEFDDFQKLFKNRYKKIKSILEDRIPTVLEISKLGHKHRGKGITVVGSVWKKTVYDSGYHFIYLEDPRTNNLLPVGWSEEDVNKDLFEEVVNDEVIAVRGRLTDDGDTLWGDNEVRRGRQPIIFPDIPDNTIESTINTSVEVALVSDIHVGADEFRPQKWVDFVRWVRSNPAVKYVIVAGDIVEGVGVYPDQEDELQVLDIYDQYAFAAAMFDQLPDDVQILASVGNHDAVRLAEPQPQLPDDYRTFFSENVEFIGNPVTVTIEGVEFLVYHGMSINALSEELPGYDASKPLPIMEQMLRKRHLSPVYGKNVRLAPETSDYLVIENPPDVLHCGHVHKYGRDEYKNTVICNTAAWQGQTQFQKSKGIDPDVGYWSVVDLSTGEVTDKNV